MKKSDNVTQIILDLNFISLTLKNGVMLFNTIFYLFQKELSSVNSFTYELNLAHQFTLFPFVLI